MIEVTVKENGFSRRVLFSGDIGRPHQLIIREPAVPDSPDLMLCESTYGDRLHAPDDHHLRLASVVRETVERGGQIVIPAFAVGRSQELLYIFRELIAQNAMPVLPIYVDSPMAIDATDLYRRHHEDHNLETDDLEKHGARLFAQPNVHFERSVADSKALNDVHDPCIIISASGMVTGGRILHHLERCLPDSRNTVVFVGYQGAGTRGQTIQSGAKSVKLLGETVPIQAHIETMEHLSGHADYGEILALLGKFDKAPSLTYLVHGEPQAAESLKQKISQQLKWNVTIPKYLDKVPL